MGGIIAKLDSDNKVLGFRSQKVISEENKKTLIDYYNKHGLLNVSLNTDKIKKVMNNYISNLSMIDDKFLNRSFQYHLTSTNINILIGTNTGLFMLDSATQEPKFNLVEYFEELNYASYENFSSEEQQALPQMNNVMSSEEQQALPQMNNVMSSEEQQALPQMNNVMSSEEQQALPQMNNVMSSEEQSRPKEVIPKEIKMIIPKILLTSERKEFLNFLIIILEVKDRMMYEIVNSLLDKISLEPNSEVKIFNLINLVVRVSIIERILSETKKMGPNVFSQDNQNKFISMVLMDVLSILPSDKCLFNDDQNIFEFNPDVCKIKQSCKECTKCEAPKLESFSETTCPVCDETECDCSKCPDKDDKLSKLITIVLVVIALIFVLLYFTKKCPELKNLAKLNNE